MKSSEWAFIKGAVAILLVFCIIGVISLFKTAPEITDEATQTSAIDSAINLSMSFYKSIEEIELGIIPLSQKDSILSEIKARLDRWEEQLTTTERHLLMITQEHLGQELINNLEGEILIK